MSDKKTEHELLKNFIEALSRKSETYASVLEELKNISNDLANKPESLANDLKELKTVCESLSKKSETFAKILAKLELIPKTLSCKTKEHSLANVNLNEFWNKDVWTKIRLKIWNLSNALAGLYAILVLIPLGAYVIKPDLVNVRSEYSVIRLGLVFYTLIIVCGPPIYYWGLCSSFNRWLYSDRVIDPNLKPSLERQRQVANFKVHVDRGRAVWSAVLAVYAALLLKG
jgi:hypothetical protein